MDSGVIGVYGNVYTQPAAVHNYGRMLISTEIGMLKQEENVDKNRV